MTSSYRFNYCLCWRFVWCCRSMWSDRMTHTLLTRAKVKRLRFRNQLIITAKKRSVRFSPHQSHLWPLTFPFFYSMKRNTMDTNRMDLATILTVDTVWVPGGLVTLFPYFRRLWQQTVASREKRKSTPGIRKLWIQRQEWNLPWSGIHCG